MSKPVKFPYRNDLHRLMSQPESWFKVKKEKKKPKNDGMISACKCHTKKRCPIHSKLYK